MPKTPHRIEWMPGATIEEINERMTQLCANLEENFRALDEAQDETTTESDTDVLKVQVFS